MTLDHASNQYKALGHPARLRIINLLSQQDSLCVCELMRVLAFGQSFVSRHLAILRDAELVVAEKKGTWAHYRLLPATAPLLSAIDLTQISELQADLTRLNQSVCEAC
ncbi:MAG: metalloregulator ArsR/SmtB family transcription factor [Thiomicrospira sp.]|uniref:ArsR/SmtB family transcription factor n=1 Tax=Thiomicrospira sp. TaxID=935 RepID=UPI0019FE29F6|nr:metalloregulator ArsR/SmtB family transcription factor [Thiomicrospira sp.]MBE0492868.1 metalloregulator ArsR/SmtB family transcription factor [Thiomicrospira sp.]